MLLYRYDRTPNCKSIQYSMEPASGKISGKGEPKTIISASPTISIGDVSFVYDMASGRFYLYNEKDLKSTICAEAILVPQCQRGIAMYDRNSGDKKKIEQIGRGGRVYLTFDFTTDKDGCIWSKVFTLDDGYRNVENDGYIIYKNSRNNFANVQFTDSTLKTVLTNGEVNEAKVEKMISGNAIQRPRLRAAVPAGPGGDGIGDGGNTDTGIVPDNTTDMDLNVEKYMARVPGAGIQANAAIPGEQYMYTRYMPFSVGMKTKNYAHSIATGGPKTTVNLNGFPKVTRFVSDGIYEGETQGYWEYDYTLNYQNGLGNLTKLYEDYNLETRSIYANTRNNIERYNRFKLAYPDDILSRGYMHIFMTRPDLNYFSSVSDLRSEVKNDPFLAYINRKNPSLVKQLVDLNGDNHQFMMLLSNKAKGFTLTDDGINHDTYGKSRHGYSVAYGRRRDSELGGSLNITYKDTRDFDILNLHKLWVDYIINVFSGKWTPKSKYIRDKIIDYATSVYVLVTAEDFETVLFWTKYYGVFPVSLPFSAIAWDGDRSTVSAPDLQVTYAYAWKEDLNPVALSELNMNSFKGGIPKQARYRPTYNQRIAAVNNTWVGAPFIEIIRYPSDQLDLTNGTGVAIKLRFQP